MSGIIIIDKSKGYSSFSVVAKIRKILNIKKIGHTGTLDPLATGVLPVCVGEATKLSDFIMDGDKVYEVTAKLGTRTDTLDADGVCVDRGIKDPGLVDSVTVRATISKFIGDIYQIPPMFSAIKKDGVPLYKLARKGQQIEREKRKITISEIKILEIAPPYLRLRIFCSKGTYIRTLIDDIGVELGTFAHVTELRRIKNGLFDINSAIIINEQTTYDELVSKIIPIEKIVKLIFPCVDVDYNTANKIANGYVLDLGLQDLGAVFSKDKNGIEKVVSINRASKTLRVFNYDEWKGTC
ncbi:MAG: tRNA pseudouridine(55) synthase TruB [bacterium]